MGEHDDMGPYPDERESATFSDDDAVPFSSDDDESAIDLYGGQDDGALFEGDLGDLEPEARYALTRLVRDRYVSDESGGRYRMSPYALVIKHRHDVQRNLNNLCLTLNVNEKYRVAWASTAPFDGNNPGVVLKRGVVQKRDVTLLLVTLRIAAQNAELEGHEHWYIDRTSIDESFTTLSPYASEGDASLVRRRIDAAIAEACTCGYLERVRMVEGRFRIMPIVAAMLTLDRAQTLIAQLGELMAGKGERDG